jgi:hypothetical protein
MANSNTEAAAPPQAGTPSVTEASPAPPQEALAAKATSVLLRPQKPGTA